MSRGAVMDDIWDVSTKFLANRMKTKGQLEIHLQNKGYDKTEIVDVLGRCEEFGYLDDAEYAAVYFSHRIPKGYAFQRIALELSQRGVSQNDIQAGLERFVAEKGYDPFEDELKRGRDEAQKILRGMPHDKKTLAKAGRKLVSLGYQPETIYTIIGEYMRGKNQ